MTSMQISRALQPADLFSLEQYARTRAAFRARVIEHKKLRNVGVGPHTTWCFEDRLTVQYQIQEMLRTERIFEPEGIAEELESYNPLIPDGTQPQGDAADRIHGCGRAPRGSGAPEGTREALLARGRRRALFCDRGRGPGTRERDQDLRGAFPALRTEPGRLRRTEGRRRR